MKCVICGNEIVGFCNNALPVKDGRCCGACNDTVVIPTRLQKSMDRAVELAKSATARREFLRRGGRTKLP